MLITSFPVVSAVKLLLLIKMSRCVGECISRNSLQWSAYGRMLSNISRPKIDTFLCIL